MVRIFAHRGYVAKKELQNSVFALKEARKVGFAAIEFDIWFLEKKLILAHDEPILSSREKLAQFDDFLLFGNEIDYWLDFKNLDESNVLEAISLVKAKLEFAKIDLNRVYFAPFITDYALAKKIFAKIKKVFEPHSVQMVAVCEKTESFDDLEIFLRENQVKFLSIFYQLIDKNLVKRLEGVTFFAWTVNELEVMQKLESIGVSNFASDKIFPDKFFALS